MPNPWDNDRLGYRTDLYGVSFETEAIHNMSLCVAFVDHEDGVIAADGRLMRKGEVASEAVLKTMRLSDSLAVGFVGRMGEIQRVQAALAPRYSWTDSARFCRDWEDAGLSVAFSFRSARDKIQAEIERIRREATPVDVEPGIGVLLMGRARGKPVLWGWDNSEGSEPREETWGFLAIGARPPEGSRELGRFGKMIAESRRNKNAEARLGRAIRYCADELGYHAVNGNVCARRLSSRFSENWLIR